MNNSQHYLAELIIDVVPKTMQTIRQDMRKERGELSITQFRMLANVKHGVSNNKELGEKLGVSEAAVSRMIDILVLEKLIKKIVNEDDRRNKVLSLTANGKKLFEKITSSARGRLAEKLELMDKKDREAAIFGLEVLQKNLELFKQ